MGWEDGQWRILQAFVDLVDSVTIISFGFIVTNWSMDFVCWNAKRICKKKIAVRQIIEHGKPQGWDTREPFKQEK